MKKILLSLILLIASAGVASAIPISGTGEWGSFEGFFDVSGDAVTVTLTNTSQEDNGGYLTAFAFALPTNITVVNFSSDVGWSLLTNPNTKPYDGLDSGATGNTDSSEQTWWEAGGNPSSGLAVGYLGNFSFSLSPSTTLEAIIGAANPWFAARFMGFENGESDKVAVPEPATVLFLGIGLLGLVVLRRKYTA